MRFRLFGFDIEFNITMLFLFLIVGRSLEPMTAVIAGIGAVLSILIHELGHAFVARSVGGDVLGITLHGMGGVTMWRGPTAGWRRIVVASAGSLVSIIIGLGLWAAASAGLLGDLAQLVMDRPWSVYLGNAINEGNLVVFFVAIFMWFNVVWGGFNLLPIAGLDGGTILSETLEKIVPGSGRLHGAIIGAMVAALVGFLAYQRGYDLVPLVLAFFAGRALFQAIREHQSR